MKHSATLLSRGALFVALLLLCSVAPLQAAQTTVSIDLWGIGTSDAAAPQTPFTQDGVTVTSTTLMTIKNKTDGYCTKGDYHLAAGKAYVEDFGTTKPTMTIDVGAGNKIVSVSVNGAHTSSGTTTKTCGHAAFSADQTTYSEYSNVILDGYDRCGNITFQPVGDYRYFTFGRGAIGGVSPSANAEFLLFHLEVVYEPAGPDPEPEPEPDPDPVASGYCLSVYNATPEYSTADTYLTFAQTDDAHQFEIRNFVVPAASGDGPKYWVGENKAWSNAFSANADLSNLPLNTTNSVNQQTLGACAGAIGTITIDDTDKSTANNLLPHFTPSGYGLCWGLGSGTWAPADYLPFEEVDAAAHTYVTPVVTLTDDQIHEWQCYVGFQAESTNSNRFVFSSTNSNSSSFIGQLPVRYTIASEESDTRLDDTYGAGIRGRFRIWSDHRTNATGTLDNFGLHFVPYFSLVYVSNYPDGDGPANKESEVVSIEDTKALSIDQAFAAPAGYRFKGWSLGNATPDASATLYQAGDTYNFDNPQNNATFYAIWEADAQDESVCGLINESTCQGSGIATLGAEPNLVHLYSASGDSWSETLGISTSNRINTKTLENVSYHTFGASSGKKNFLVQFPVPVSQIVLRSASYSTTQVAVTACHEATELTTPTWLSTTPAYTASITHSEIEGNNNGMDEVTITFDQPFPSTSILCITTTVRMQVYQICFEKACDLPTGLSYSAATATAALGETPALPVLTNTNNYALTYSSSNAAVATIDNTGAVTLLSPGTTTITASYAGDAAAKICAYDCSYELTVTCADLAPQISAPSTAIQCGEVTLTLVENDGTTPVSTGSVQWLKDGVAISGATAYTYAAAEAGVYTATLTRACELTTSNSVTLTAVSSAAVFTPRGGTLSIQISGREIDGEAVRPYDNTQRLLATLHNVTPTFALSLVHADGTNTAISGTPAWLQQTADGTDLRLTASWSDLLNWLNQNNYTTVGDILRITVSATNVCGDLETHDIDILLTNKFSIAYILDGTADGGFYDYSTAHASASTLLADLKTKYIVDAVNAYAAYDYANYQPYDLLVLTDYPKYSGSSSQPKKIDAMADLVDRKPVFSLKAHMASSQAWKDKGFVATPQVPGITGNSGTAVGQTTLTVLCYAHAMFEHVTWDSGVDGQITVLSQVGKESSKDKGLQGFKAEDIPGFVNIATIPNGLADNGLLVACCERQVVAQARFLMLSIASVSHPYINAAGQTMAEDIIAYLLSDDLTKVSDCSIVFDNGDADFDGVIDGDRTGAAGNHRWNEPMNWSSHQVPNRAQNVQIKADCEVRGDVREVANVRIDPNHTLTIYPDGGLYSTGVFGYASASNMEMTPISDPNHFFVKSDASATGMLMSLNVQRLAATVEMYSPAFITMDGTKKKKHWSYVALPMQSTTIATAEGGNLYGAYTYKWSEGTGWARYNDGMVINGFDAVALSQTAPQTFTFKGDLNLSQDHTFTLANSGGTYKGINLIGNSWLAPIQIDKMTGDMFGEGLEQTIYIYNTGRDATYGVGAAGNGDDATAGQWRTIPISAVQLAGWAGPTVIPAMQAFEIDFLHQSAVSGAAGVPEPSSATLTLSYNTLVHSEQLPSVTNHPLYAPKQLADEPTLMRLRVADSKTYTDLYLLQSDRFTEAFDNGWEGGFVEGDGRSASLYAVCQAGNLAVAALPELDGTTIAFRQGQEQVYTFSFAYEGAPLYLNDMLLHQSTRIDNAATYTFTATESDPANRFVVSAEPYAGVVTGLAEVVYNENGCFINNPAAETLRLTLFDATGKLLSCVTTAEPMVAIPYPAAEGVYLVHIQSNGTDKVLKLIR